MFNESQKNAFIEETSTKVEAVKKSTYRINPVFEWTEMHLENRMKKDISELKLKDVIDTYNHCFYSPQYSTLRDHLQVISSYVRWVWNRHAAIDGDIIYVPDLDIFDLSPICKASLAPNYETIADYLCEYIPSEGFLERPVAALVWNQLSFKQIEQITMDDISTDGKSFFLIDHKGGTSFRREITGHMEVSDLSVYIHPVCQNNRRGEKDFSPRKLIETGYYIRRFEPYSKKITKDRYNAQEIATKLGRALRESDSNISPTEIKLSGLFYKYYNEYGSRIESIRKHVGATKRGGSTKADDLILTYQAYLKAFHRKSKNDA